MIEQPYNIPVELPQLSEASVETIITLKQDFVDASKVVPEYYAKHREVLQELLSLGVLQQYHIGTITYISLTILGKQVQKWMEDRINDGTLVIK